MSEGYIDISHNVVGLMLQREAEIAKAKCNNTAYLRQQTQMSLFVLKKHICQVGALLSVAVLVCLYFYILLLLPVVFPPYHICVLLLLADISNVVQPSPALNLCYLFQTQWHASLCAPISLSQIICSSGFKTLIHNYRHCQLTHRRQLVPSLPL